MSEVWTEVEGHSVKLSNLDKVLYPVTGTTKGEVLDYYVRIAPVLLPHLADRAVTRIRWPHGVGDKSFFEKNAPAGAPSWLRTVRVPTTGSRGTSRHGNQLRFPVVDGVAPLVWLANLASLELHVHQWRVGADRGSSPDPVVPEEVAPERVAPDRLVIDLDPGEPAGLPECARVALLVRDELGEHGLDAFPVTSGSKGLHLYAPLDGTLGSDEVTELAKGIGEGLQAAHPKLVTAVMTKAKRGGKVFLDWSQNAASKTTVSPYSLRGRERPYVATPRTWVEVEEGAEDPLALEQCRFEEVLERVEEWGDLFGA